MSKNPLNEGVVGSKLVAYLSNYADTDKVPVEAVMLKRLPDNQVQYRITFDDESVSDWLITFEPNSTDIASAELFNEVM